MLHPDADTPSASNTSSNANNDTQEFGAGAGEDCKLAYLRAVYDAMVDTPYIQPFKPPHSHLFVLRLRRALLRGMP